MLRFLKTTFSDKINIAHAVVFCVLIAISIYSVCSVVNSFLFDNITTTVTIGHSVNPLSFSNGLTVLFRYRDIGMIFPETWTMNKSELKAIFPDGWSAGKQVEKAKNDSIFHWNANSTLSLRDCIDVASATGVIGAYDKNFFYSFTGKTTNSEASDRSKLDDTMVFFQNLSIGVPANGDILTFPSPGKHSVKMVTKLNTFLRNPLAADFVEKTIARITGPTFARAVDPKTKANTIYIPFKPVVDSLSVVRMEVFIPFDFIGNTSTMDIEIELIPFNISAPPAFVEERNVVAPFQHPDQITFFNSDPALLNVSLIRGTSINLENTGIFDSTNVRTDCKPCENYHSVEDCDFKCYLDSVIELCECIPFTYRRLHDDRKFPFCTVSDYAKCFKTKKFDPATCKEIKPCILKQNFQNSKHYGERENYETGNNMSYRLSYRIKCEQKTFIILKQSFQNTWMEMLGQMGGNLGMFLSFSFLGLWQFFIYLYNYYQQRTGDPQKMEDESPPAPVSGTLMSSWLLMAKLSARPAGRGVGTSDQSELIGGLQQKSEILERRGERLEEILENVKANQDVLMEKLQETKAIAARSRKASDTK